MRLLAAALALCLLLLTGCSGGRNDAADESGDPAENAADIPETADSETASGAAPEDLFAAMAGDYRLSIGAGAWRTEELLVYLPGADTADLPEEFLRWAGPRWRSTEDGALGRYGIYNAAEETGFAGAEQIY